MCSNEKLHHCSVIVLQQSMLNIAALLFFYGFYFSIFMKRKRGFHLIFFFPSNIFTHPDVYLPQCVLHRENVHIRVYFKSNGGTSEIHISFSLNPHLNWVHLTGQKSSSSSLVTTETCLRTTQELCGYYIKWSAGSCQVNIVYDHGCAGDTFGLFKTLVF